MSNTKENLDLFLLPTKSCDFDNPLIEAKVAEIVKGLEEPSEKALQIFYWVRDNIKFGISTYFARASRTLKKGFGECGNKTNLHIAFLRCAGIPARLKVSVVKKDPLEPIIPAFVYNRIGPHASHFWTECYLEDRWISCELLIDKELYDSLINQGKITLAQIPTIDWDGKNDLIILKHWLVEDKGYVNSYDEILVNLLKNRKKEGLPPLIIEKLFGNFIYNQLAKYTDKIRKGEK